jgi:hypothetical protein
VNEFLDSYLRKESFHFLFHLAVIPQKVDFILKFKGIRAVRRYFECFQ